MRLIDADALKRRLNDWCGPYHKGGDEIQIDILVDMIDEESSVFGWISVKDALPESGARVLVYIRGHGMVKPHSTVWTFEDVEREVWEECVTHWMPLPDLPEVEE